MLISQIPIILVLLFISVLAMSQELLGIKRTYLKILFIIVSSGLLYFSFNNNLLCSDYGSYLSIYENDYRIGTSLQIEEIIGIDKSFILLAIIFKSIFDSSDFSLFLRIYQTIGLGLIIFAISRLSLIWSNTVLFLIIFGSLQFYHLNLCAVRQGLSSGFIAIMFVLAINSSKKNSLKPLNFTSIGLFLLSIYCHWTAIIMGFILYISVFLDRNIFFFKSYAKNSYSKLIIYSLGIPILILLFLIPFEKIYSYLSETGGDYGRSISFTFFVDIIFIVISFYYVKIIRQKFDIETNTNEFTEYSSSSFSLVALIFISVISIFLKLLSFLGYGTAIRMIIELTMTQYLLLPVLLEKIKKLIRPLVILLLSAPYFYFIFFISQLEFQ